MEISFDEDMEISKREEDFIRENNKLKQAIRSKDRNIEKLEAELSALTHDYNDLYTQFESLDIREVELALI